MTTLWLVRHGPTHAKAAVGWTDLPADLSDTAALDRLAGFLPDAPVVSSDLSRAIATADAITGARPRLAHLPGLREQNFGAWEMKSAAEIEALDPDRSRAFWTDPEHVAPPGGETFTALAARVDAALAPLAQHAHLIVVAHFGVILTRLWRARGGSVPEVLAQPIDNLSVTEITLGRAPRLGVINHCP